MQYIGLSVLLKRLGAIGSMMKDKKVKLRKKLLVVLGALYILMPFDLIPIVIFPVAWMDDLFVFCIILWYLKDELDRYWLGEKEVDLSKKFSGKDILEGVEYKVECEDEHGK